MREQEAPADLSSLECLYPTRLRNGVYDGDESAQVPLADMLAPTQPVPLSAVGPGPLEEWPGVRRRANSR